MKDLIIEIPTIKDTQTDFNKLFKIYQKIEDNLSPIKNVNRFLYDFSHCRTIYPNAIAFLFGLIQYLKSNKKEIFYIKGSLKKRIQSQLAANGFLNKLDSSEEYLEKETLVPLREDRDIGNENLIIDYLQNKWLPKNWIHLSDLVRHAIVGKVWEIYDNAFSHAFSPIGIYSCGQKIDNKIKLAIIDFGKGIPLNVTKYLKKDIPSSEALKWAFKDGNTTKKENRGLGLGFLKSFVKLNKGELEIFSGTGHVKINEKDERFTTKKTYLNGTLIYITLMCDDKYYRFTHEASTISTKPLF
jgi:hypothetical protein